MGQSFLQSFFFPYHFTILVQGPEILFFMFCNISHLYSQHEHEAQLVGRDWRQETAPGEPSAGFMELPIYQVAWQAKPFCSIGECGRLCFDQRFGSILFLAHFIVLCGYTQESWILFPRQILQLRATVTQWILRAWSNFVPGLQCASTADSPPCSQVHGWYISVHIKFHNQYALSGSLIFILLSLY